MKLLTLSVDGLGGGRTQINPPAGIPTGGINKLADIISGLLGVIIVFAIVFALFMLIYAGWQWMTSSGDKQKLQQVRQRIAYILVGLVVVFASFLVISLIGNFFGTNLLNLR